MLRCFFLDRIRGFDQQPVQFLFARTGLGVVSPEMRRRFEAGIANPTNDQYLKLCQEGVARSLKTEDGAIARANAYTLSPDKAIVRSQYLP